MYSQYLGTIYFVSSHKTITTTNSHFFNFQIWMIFGNSLSIQPMQISSENFSKQFQENTKERLVKRQFEKKCLYSICWLSEWLKFKVLRSVSSFFRIPRQSVCIINDNLMGSVILRIIINLQSFTTWLSTEHSASYTDHF